MAAVAVQLGRVAISGPLSAALAAGAALALWRTRVNPSWLVLAGLPPAWPRGSWAESH